jgi:hypothetical protein
MKETSPLLTRLRGMLAHLKDFSPYFLHRQSYHRISSSTSIGVSSARDRKRTNPAVLIFLYFRGFPHIGYAAAILVTWR